MFIVRNLSGAKHWRAMTKLGFLSFLGLVAVIGKSTESAQERAYVGLHKFLNPQRQLTYSADQVSE